MLEYLPISGGPHPLPDGRLVIPLNWITLERLEELTGSKLDESFWDFTEAANAAAEHRKQKTEKEHGKQAD